MYPWCATCKKSEKISLSNFEKLRYTIYLMTSAIYSAIFQSWIIYFITFLACAPLLVLLPYKNHVFFFFLTNLNLSIYCLIDLIHQLATSQQNCFISIIIKYPIREMTLNRLINVNGICVSFISRVAGFLCSHSSPKRVLVSWNNSIILNV